MKIYEKLKLVIFFFIFFLSWLIFNIEEENEKTLPYNRYKYLKEFKKELCIYLPAQELESTGPLSSILVQYGLNVKDFAEKFNKASNIYPAGLRIPVSIFYTMKEKRYTFCFRPLQLKILLEQCITFDENRFIYKVHIVDLYKVFLLKKDILNEKNDLRLRSNFFGTLRSYDYPVIIFFDHMDEHSINNLLVEKINRFYVDDYEESVNPDLALDSNIESEAILGSETESDSEVEVEN